jgi:hypothetical protein
MFVRDEGRVGGAVAGTRGPWSCWPYPKPGGGSLISRRVYHKDEDMYVPGLLLSL